jgi:hypothetical protein
MAITKKTYSVQTKTNFHEITYIIQTTGKAFVVVDYRVKTSLHLFGSPTVYEEFCACGYFVFTDSSSGSANRQWKEDLIHCCGGASGHIATLDRDVSVQEASCFGGCPDLDCTSAYHFLLKGDQRR